MSVHCSRAYYAGTRGTNVTFVTLERNNYMLRPTPDQHQTKPPPTFDHLHFDKCCPRCVYRVRDQSQWHAARDTPRTLSLESRGYCAARSSAHARRIARDGRVAQTPERRPKSCATKLLQSESTSSLSSLCFALRLASEDFALRLAAWRSTFEVREEPPGGR